MGVPLGAKSRLYFNVEETAGELAEFSASRGLRHFFNSFVIDESFQIFPLGFTGPHSMPRVHHARDRYRVGVRMSFPRRYTALHSVLDGYAMGQLVDAPGTPNVFVASIEAPYPSMSWVAQVPIGDGTESELQLVGMKVARCRWRHRANDVLRQELFLVGTGMTWVDAPSSPMPPLDEGFAPDVAVEDFVSWADHASLVFNSDPTTTLTLRSWEFVLDNAPRQVYTTGDSVKPLPPFRGGASQVRLRFEVEQDDAWEEFQEVNFGAHPDVAEPEINFGITLNYTRGSEQLIFDGDQFHVRIRNRGVSGPRGQYQTIDCQVMRSYSTAAMAIFHLNDVGQLGPTGWTSYGNII
jgi:hypothetical protein